MTMCKRYNFESQNSRHLLSNLVCSESFFESQLPDILALYETTQLILLILKDDFSFIQKDFASHLYGYLVYMQGDFPFDLSP